MIVTVAAGFRIATDSYKRVIRLLGELGELANSPPDELRRHLLQGLSALFGGPVFWTILRTEMQHSVAPEASLAMAQTDVYGLVEWQLRHWQQTIASRHVYQHPMWERLHRQPGRLRTFRREQLVDARHWYRSPYVAEVNRYLGLDDVLASAVPLGDGTEAMLALSRPWGDRRFDAHESSLIELIQPAILWVHRASCRTEEPSGLTAVDARLRQLPPRHHRVLNQLLQGLSEKEVAATCELSLRTAHKYIEQIYRALSVSSRAELMALFIGQARRPG